MTLATSTDSSGAQAFLDNDFIVTMLAVFVGAFLAFLADLVIHWFKTKTQRLADIVLLQSRLNLQFEAALNWHSDITGLVGGLGEDADRIPFNVTDFEVSNLNLDSMVFLAYKYDPNCLNELASTQRQFDVCLSALRHIKSECTFMFESNGITKARLGALRDLCNSMTSDSIPKLLIDIENAYHNVQELGIKYRGCSHELNVKLIKWPEEYSVKRQNLDS